MSPVSIPPKKKSEILLVQRRVARWHIFEPKIPIWVNFGGSCNGRCWYILWPFDLFYSRLVYFAAIWYIWYKIGINFHVLVFCIEKNLATLVQRGGKKRVGQFRGKRGNLGRKKTV
jgi:hypothetical protein